MKNAVSSKASQQGSTQGTMIWLVVLAAFGMMIKSEFFPGISVGSAASNLPLKFGQPIAKTTIPRPR